MDPLLTLLQMMKMILVQQVKERVVMMDEKLMTDLSVALFR